MFCLAPNRSRRAYCIRAQKLWLWNKIGCIAVVFAQACSFLEVRVSLLGIPILFFLFGFRSDETETFICVDLRVRGLVQIARSLVNDRIFPPGRSFDSAVQHDGRRFLTAATPRKRHEIGCIDGFPETGCCCIVHRKLVVFGLYIF